MIARKDQLLSLEELLPGTRRDYTSDQAVYIVTYAGELRRLHIRRLQRQFESRDPLDAESAVNHADEVMWRMAVRKEQRGEVFSCHYEPYHFTCAKRYLVRKGKQRERRRQAFSQICQVFPGQHSVLGWESEHSAELLRLIVRARQMLSPDEWDMFKMRYVHFCRLKAIAYVYGLSISTVQRRLKLLCQRVCDSVESTQCKEDFS